VHLDGFIVRIYHDARSHELQNRYYCIYMFRVILKQISITTLNGITWFFLIGTDYILCEVGNELSGWRKTIRFTKLVLTLTG
jgi:hypothetical protein